MAEAVSAPAEIRHSRRMISRQDDSVFLLHLQLRGRSVHWQAGREAILETGDFTLCNSAAPYGVRFDDHNDMLVARISDQQLKTHLPNAEDLTCIAISSKSPVGGIVSRYLSSLWSTYTEDSVDEPTLNSLSAPALDLLATSFAPLSKKTLAGNGQPARNSVRLRAINFIERNLFDTCLSPATVASSLGVTPRWLHKSFREHSDTIGRYILRRRLEESRRMLTDPRQRHRSLTDIALACGFSNPSHFSAAFRKRYKASPSDTRRRGA